MKNTLKEFVKLDRRLEEARERLQFSTIPESEIRMTNIKYTLAAKALLAVSSGFASSVDVDEHKADTLAKVKAYEQAVERAIKKHS